MKNYIGTSRWRRFRDLKSVPKTPGVYVFIRNGVAYYVGSTVNLRHRIREHRAIPKPLPYPLKTASNSMLECDTIKFKCSRRYGDWLMVEARLIRRLRPEANAYGRGR